MASTVAEDFELHLRNLQAQCAFLERQIETARNNRESDAAELVKGVNGLWVLKYWTVNLQDGMQKLRDKLLAQSAGPDAGVPPEDSHPDPETTSSQPSSQNGTRPIRRPVKPSLRRTPSQRAPEVEKTLNVKDLNIGTNGSSASKERNGHSKQDARVEPQIKPEEATGESNGQQNGEPIRPQDTPEAEEEEAVEADFDISHEDLSEEYRRLRERDGLRLRTDRKRKRSLSPDAHTSYGGPVGSSEDTDDLAALRSPKKKMRQYQALSKRKATPSSREGSAGSGRVEGSEDTDDLAELRSPKKRLRGYDAFLKGRTPEVELSGKSIDEMLEWSRRMKENEPI